MSPKLMMTCSSSDANDVKRQPRVRTRPPMTDVSRVDFRRQTAMTSGDTKSDTDNEMTHKTSEN